MPLRLPRASFVLDVARVGRPLAALLALRLTLRRRLDETPLDRLLESLDVPGGQALPPTEAVEALERLVERSHVAPDTCLYRALGRFAMLRGCGVEASFVMGLSPGSSFDEGHAWVEVNGARYLDTNDDEQIETFRYPPRPA